LYGFVIVTWLCIEKGMRAPPLKKSYDHGRWRKDLKINRVFGYKDPCNQAWQWKASIYRCFLLKVTCAQSKFDEHSPATDGFWWNQPLFTDDLWTSPLTERKMNDHPHLQMIFDNHLLLTRDFWWEALLYKQMCFWLVVYLPLWKIWVRQLGWLIILNIWKVIYHVMFQTTNQVLMTNHIDNLFFLACFPVDFFNGHVLTKPGGSHHWIFHPRDLWPWGDDSGCSMDWFCSESLRFKGHGF
jgi:hypothetical protein